MTGDIHLVETREGWTLTLTLTEHQRAALASGDGPATVSCTVCIEPNLVPGEPFEAQLQLSPAVRR